MPSPGRTKTFSGCWRCRERKIKCDQRLPGCGKCLQYGMRCSGYDQRLAWVGDGTSPKGYESRRRRDLDAKSTWNPDCPAYTSSQLDVMLSQLDLEHLGDQYSGSLTIAIGPYTAQRWPKSNEVSLSILARPSTNPDWSETVSELFYHYITAVAPLMMPVEHVQNPWNSVYPLMASSVQDCYQECLLNALLAQSAANLAQLGCRDDTMQRQAKSYHLKALQSLRTGLFTQRPGYVPLLAAILTIIMAETYLGIRNTWRTHLDAAWQFAVSNAVATPWMQNDNEWTVSQSLCLLRIRACSTNVLSSVPRQIDIEHGLDPRNSLITSTMSRQEFGYTAGLDRGIAQCIIDIEDLARDPDASPNSLPAQNILTYIQARLHQNRQEISSFKPKTKWTMVSTSQTATRHSNVVLNGLLIYFLGRVGKYCPASLKEHLTELLDSMDEYRQLGGRNITVWPVFHAALEADGTEHQGKVKAWLNDSMRLGIGNRLQLKYAIERAWKYRQSMAKSLGLPTGLVRVDWRVMSFELDMDILLV